MGGVHSIVFFQTLHPESMKFHFFETFQDTFGNRYHVLSTEKFTIAINIVDIALPQSYISLEK